MTDIPPGSDQQPPVPGYQAQGPGYQPQGPGYQAQGPGYQPQGPGYQPQGPGYQPQGPGYQPPAPGYAQPKLKVTPGRIWYLIPAAVFLAGIAWLIYGVVTLASTVNDLQRVSLPGGGTVSLTHSGGYTIYYEGPGAQTGNIPPFHIHVTPASPGAAVSSLTQYGSVVTYNIGSHEGRAVLALRVASPGRFTVTALGAPASGAGLAFGGSIGSGIVGVLLPGVPLIILGVLGAVVLLIVRIVRKRSLQRRAALSGYAQSGPVS
ncbi:MAG TPA: hypothetical protein VF834_19570 [Streptosporangiaceae bacterium]